MKKSHRKLNITEVILISFRIPILEGTFSCQLAKKANLLKIKMKWVKRMSVTASRVMATSTSYISYLFGH